MNGKQARRASSHPKSIVAWLLLRIVACASLGVLADHALALLRIQRPGSLVLATTVASSAFGLFAACYLYWAVRFSSPDGFRASALGRLGLLCSALGALLIAAKLGFPDDVPGPPLGYFLSALGLSLILRPLLERAGLKTQKKTSLGL